MKVRVLFFGVLAEKAEAATIEIEGAKDLQALEQLILERYPDFKYYS